MNMNFDELYKSLDEPLEPLEKKEDCCSNPDNHFNNDGKLICNICNQYISNILTTPEWVNYSNEKTNPTRCGMPINILLPESSVGSTIGLGNNNKTMNQIRRYQQYTSMPYKERSRYKVFNYITDICLKNNINNKIINESHSLYSIISKTKISRGKNRDGIIAACVFYACKEVGCPRSTKEIARIFDLNITIITKGCKKFTEILHLNKGHRLNNSSCINPSDFVERFCNNFDFNENDINNIKKICKKADDLNIIAENTPPSFAAGCIYYYIKKRDLEYTKKQISEICNISEVTINKCYKKLQESNKL